ncbi:MAG TPA: sigma 54-interacting transcriptional regulator [Desulfobacteraceae bacterium]|nr:sigma 54-interacting transcriptional regulator [Desulfobacteraceae bacterium]
MKNQEFWNVNFLNQIIETMADGLFTLDSKGRITSWNPAMERISGYRADEAMGKGCNVLQCSRCFGKECPTDIAKCGIMEQRVSHAKECHVTHKQGHEVPVIKSARVITDDQGEIMGIVESITDLTEMHWLKKKAEEAERRLGEKHRLDNIIGKSPVMKNVFEAVTAAANSRATVLIRGESGTGKELVAGAIHYHSDQSDHAMVTVNCSALSEHLLESELFGHVKGAFTGAHRDRTGRFEEADKGTIFLDEIGELTPYMQVKLLRALQEREIERVGESKKRKIDIRIIAATHQDLYQLVQQGRFREDLFYRLKVFPVTVPPLRRRREDIPLLVRYFMDKGNNREKKTIGHVAPDAMKKLMEYPWPGNVRELENAIEHAFVLCRSGQIETEHLPVEIINSSRTYSREEPQNSSVFRENQGGQKTAGTTPTKEELEKLLGLCNWNKAEVARRIGKSRTSVWKYMKKMNIPMKTA